MTERMIDLQIELAKQEQLKPGFITLLGSKQSKISTDGIHPGISGISAGIGPALSRILKDNIIQNTKVISSIDLTTLCMSTLLICLPHGYGFIPVLPNSDNYSIRLRFGKLGSPIGNVVDIVYENDSLLLKILGDKTYNSSEIRLFALRIVERINELNGIEENDSEQDDKGSD